MQHIDQSPLPSKQKMGRNANFIFIFFFILCIAPQKIQCKVHDAKEHPPHSGNFAIPGKGPHPLLSFGENILPEGKVGSAVFADTRQAQSANVTEILPVVACGLRKDVSVLVAASTVLDSPLGVGVTDIVIQFEHALYAKKTSTFTEQATIVVNAGLPINGAAAPQRLYISTSGFFMGATYNRTYTDWVFFTSYGGSLSTTKDEIKFGNAFLYQAGIGRNILGIRDEYLLTGLVELTGTYKGQTLIANIVYPNSGGNTVFVTPSLIFATKRATFHVGMGFPVQQNLLGEQSRRQYILAGAISWAYDQ